MRSENYFDMKKQMQFALDKAESIVAAAEQTGRALTAAEQSEYDVAMTAAHTLSAKVAKIQSHNTMSKVLANGGLFVDPTSGVRNAWKDSRIFTSEYETDFLTYVASNGQQIGAAMYEGNSSLGGYAVPSMVDGVIVPLAPADTGVRQLATIIPTVMDVKIPRQITNSTAASKAEGTGNGSNVFTESDPTLDQFTLSAFMAGLSHTISWELAQDVPSFQAFAVSDMLLAQSVFEENWFVNGTGSAQPQGLLGNVGAGITGVLAGSDNYGSELLDATFDVMGALKTVYHANASWLMSRATSIALRKAQKQANLFEPVFVRVGGQDYLHGYPVVYSTAMPSIAAGATPLLFGDFKQGYVIGDRGGAGINLKILDQPRATEGLVVFLAYRRTDGRVRRSEAIQPIVLHS